MASPTLDQALKTLNETLGEITPYKLVVLDPKAIVPLEGNPHFMPKRVFDQLQDNIGKDGNLQSLPFLWFDGERYHCLSGNHRVDAAIREKIEAILCLYTDAELSADERVAIALAHNSLVGDDDVSKIKSLWENLHSAHLQAYSGWDAKALSALESANVNLIGDKGLAFEEIRLLFLGSDVERIEALVKQLGTAERKRFVAQVEVFDRFFELMLKVKEVRGIINSSTAFLALIEIGERYLAETAEPGTKPQ